MSVLSLVCSVLLAMYMPCVFSHVYGMYVLCVLYSYYCVYLVCSLFSVVCMFCMFIYGSSVYVMCALCTCYFVCPFVVITVRQRCPDCMSMYLPFGAYGIDLDSHWIKSKIVVLVEKEHSFSCLCKVILDETAAQVSVFPMIQQSLSANGYEIASTPRILVAFHHSISTYLLRMHSSIPIATTCYIPTFHIYIILTDE